MAYLANVPSDIVFQVISGMRLQDAWTLTAVSRRFYDLGADRSYWIIALKASPSIQSVSNPLTLDDLNAMDLTALKELVQHSMKLDRNAEKLENNWSLPKPEIIGEVRRFSLGIQSILETNHLFQFPGSELFVFYSSKLLKCFNFGTGEYTTVLDLGAYVRCVAYDFLPDKSVVLGVALQGGSKFNIPTLLFVQVRLDRNRSRITATVLLQPTLAIGSDCQKPFVSSRIVGAVQTRGGATEILAYDLISGGCTTIETDIPTNQYTISRRLDFSFYQDSLYLLADDGPRALVYCCPRTSLPYGRHSATTTSILTFGDMDPFVFPTNTWKRRGPVCSQMLRDGSFVKVHDCLGLPGSQFVTTFRFWRLNTSLPHELTAPGMCSGELTLRMGLTGCNVVASLIRLGQAGCNLVLVRSRPDLDSCSSHELELPAGVGIGPPPNVLAVDDCRGVVWLVDGGDLVSVPYV
ncbi:hypothetical protein C8R43DRAFT_1047277 [Mycena crocata]|nr:hypothetical protein C8R43DRAFT_1047277 [Mycena crocata]